MKRLCVLVSLGIAWAAGARELHAQAAPEASASATASEGSAPVAAPEGSAPVAAPEGSAPATAPEGSAPVAAPEAPGASAMPAVPGSEVAPVTTSVATPAAAPNSSAAAIGAASASSSAEAAATSDAVAPSGAVAPVTATAVDNAGDDSLSLEAIVAAPVVSPAASVETTLDKDKGAKRPYSVSAGSEFSSLVITNTAAPPNDKVFNWTVNASYAVFEGAKATIMVGAIERFTADPGEGPFLFNDTVLGLSYKQTARLPFALWGLDQRKLELSHRARLYLPSSRVSLKQTLYCAPEVKSTARMVIVPSLPRLKAGLGGLLQYRFHEKAERAGTHGGMNTRLAGGVTLSFEYVILEESPWGDLSVSADGSTMYRVRYTSRDTYESASSSATFLAQQYGYTIGASYTPPKMPYLSVDVAIQQNAGVLRNGVVNMYVANRDLTEFALGVTGTY